MQAARRLFRTPLHKLATGLQSALLHLAAAVEAAAAANPVRSCTPAYVRGFPCGGRVHAPLALCYARCVLPALCGVVLRAGGRADWGDTACGRHMGTARALGLREQAYCALVHTCVWWVAGWGVWGGGVDFGRVSCDSGGPMQTSRHLRCQFSPPPSSTQPPAQPCRALFRLWRNHAHAAAPLRSPSCALREPTCPRAALGWERKLKRWRGVRCRSREPGLHPSERIHSSGSSSSSSRAWGRGRRLLQAAAPAASCKAGQSMEVRHAAAITSSTGLRKELAGQECISATGALVQLLWGVGVLVLFEGQPPRVQFASIS
jgi:hypothetical protein